MDGGFRFSVISTFSVAGASSLGRSKRGGQVLLAVNHDAEAVATYRVTFSVTPVYHGDIVQLGAEKCCRLARVLSGELDVLDGSSSCLGFNLLAVLEA